MSAELAARVAEPPVAGRSLWMDAWRTLRRNRAAVVSAVVIAVMAVLVIIGPFLSQYDYDFTDWGNLSIGPNLESGHLFGTDTLGRDLFVRTLVGGRISLMVGIVATFVRAKNTEFFLFIQEIFARGDDTTTFLRLPWL